MASLSNWYNNQYGNWNRTRRMSTAPYLARTNTGASRTAAAMHRNNSNNLDGAVVIDMGDLADNSNSNTASGESKKQETLFGPNIGLVNSGPAWTENGRDGEKGAVDQLTPDVVKGWIAKSKETSHATTTLQALVNLKRPTIRLSPLTLDSEEQQEQGQDHHGLEFEYDCDAPKCGIYMHVLLSPDHSQAQALADIDKENQADGSKKGLSKVIIFETTVDGGFGKKLHINEGATLELGLYDLQSSTEDPSASNAALDSTATPGASAAKNERERKSRRFTGLHFRKRDQSHQQNHSVAGPALAVVDAEVIGKDAKDAKSDAEEGVRVVIKLVALDNQGQPMASPNEQSTYLHVVRMGPAPAAPTGEGVEESHSDARQWVVKVVKREATIGPHTFHLHEIYGLTSQSSAPSQPTAPLAAAPSGTTATDGEGESHTYPPAPLTTTPTIPTATAPAHEDDPSSSECLVCLSSPREVVLLPCRHLVACKDCALNMVEFGAGGVIVQNEEPAPAAAAQGVAVTAGTEALTTVGADEEAGGATPVINASETATPAAQTAQTARRKRKAKGWFCPVCRQPYTSLLRLTSSPPILESKDGARDSNSSDGVEPAVATAPTSRLAALRPNFLRGMSRGSMTGITASTEPAPPVPTLPPDSERGSDPVTT